MFGEIAAALLLAVPQVLPITVPFGKPRPAQERVVPAADAGGRQFAAQCKESTDWDKPAPPVRIYGNTYLVGTCGISSILIAGSAGHILIDAGTEAGADLIAANIRQLGFRLQDIRILLYSHEHLDHVGGLSKLQRMTGAQVFASPAAAAVFKTGAAGAGDPQAGMHPPFPAVQVDRILRDGEQVILGDLGLVAVATPGHTPGALSWHWGSCAGAVCRRIVYADSLTPISREGYRFSDHPDYLKAYRASIRKIAALDCDILLTPHPSASDMAERLSGRKPLENRDACREYAAALDKHLDERLAKEAAEKK